ncbi:MAG: TraR/DksA family transcriptional regulator [Candidatus Sericytochromatia bacterium]|nr:TraR/DksA family transcriptional regulator [Candidatus Sericytochromatia bacterium]
MTAFDKHRQELERTRARLNEHILAHRSSIKSHGSHSVQDAYSNSGDSEWVDDASDTYAMALDVSMLERYKHRLQLVESALRRMAENHYGQCIRCQEGIGRERLTAIPETPYCRDCEAEVEVDA